MGCQLFRFLTTTVGLVAVRHESGVNVMAAEWTYFVARDPLHVAVGIGDGGLTQRLIEEAGEFSVTVCSASQASVANFVGSFSGVDVDKTSSDLIELVPPVETSTPRVQGGVFSAECPVVATVDLPGYKLFVGEALAIRVDDVASLDPLVKHGGMYRLGEPICDDALAVAAELLDGYEPALRVAASLQAGERQDSPWTVSLVAPDGRRRLLGRIASNEYGDMLEDFPLPETWPGVPISVCRVLVERPDAKPGWASVSCRQAEAAVPQGDDGRLLLSAQPASAPGGFVFPEERR